MSGRQAIGYGSENCAVADVESDAVRWGTSYGLGMSFADDAKRQQAKFRPTLSSAAQQPSDRIGRRHDYLLALGHEIENLMPELRRPDGARRFFHERKIRWWKSPQSGDDEATEGPTRNMTSSQVACVNFLLPLTTVNGALTYLLRSIDADVEEVLLIGDRDGHFSRVEFEWVGWDEPLEGGAITRGANQTSADALLVARAGTGNRAYVFEWKYCEAYLSTPDKGTGPSGATRRLRYSERYSSPSSSFTGGVPLNEFLIEPFYQLIRLRLLADRIVERGVTPSLQVADARVVVACPTGNIEYRNVVPTTPLVRRFPTLRTVEEVMRATLKDPRGLVAVAPDDLVRSLRQGSIAAALSSWLKYQADRYGW